MFINHYCIDVRQEISPRGRNEYMRCLALIAYLIAIGSFVAIFIVENRVFSIETTFQTTDLTGHNDYTCQMISKVNLEQRINGATLEPC